MNQNLENLRLALASHALVQIATVFGSFGSPREKSPSDVDIAVASTQPLTPDQKLDSMAVGFRNLCVHEYDKINWEIAYAIVTRHLDEFRQFAGLIDREA